MKIWGAFLLFFVLVFSKPAFGSACQIPDFKNDLFKTTTLTEPGQVHRQEKDVMLRYPNSSYIRPASNSPAITWKDPNFINRMYHKQTHLYDWDEFPGKKAKDYRVQSLKPDQQRQRIIPQSSGSLDTYEVGNAERPDFAIIFIHGAGGDKTLGYNDWTFGGNFNRLKNLVVNGNGVYYSPSVSHSSQGVESVAELMRTIKKKNGNAEIIVACGSAGGAICSGLSEHKVHSKNLGGVVYLGSATAPDAKNMTSIHATQFRVPTVFAHGTYDSVMGWEDMKTRYDALKAKDATYPTQYYLHHGGIHGTPIRMIDWQETVNFVLKARCEQKEAATETENVNSSASEVDQ